MNSFCPPPPSPANARYKENSFTVMTDEEWEQLQIPTTVADLVFKGYIGYYSTIFNLSPFNSLRHLTMIRNNFKNVSSLRIENMPNLDIIQIGKNSFSLLHFGDDITSTRDCHICHCPKLKSIDVGNMAFYDYTVLELHDLPSLEDLSMKRNCFYFGRQFVLQGKHVLKTTRIILFRPSIVKKAFIRRIYILSRS